MPQAFDAWFEEAKVFAKSDQSGFEDFAYRTITYMTLMQDVERFEVVDILLEKPKFKSVLECRRADFLSLVYYDFISLNFSMYSLKYGEFLLRAGFDFPVQYVYFAVGWLAANPGTAYCTILILHTLARFAGVPQDMSTLNAVQQVCFTQQRVYLLTYMIPLIIAHVNAEVAMFVFAHLGLAALGPEALLSFFEPYALRISDNGSFLYYNIEQACRLFVFELKEPGVERLRGFLLTLQGASKMNFKNISDHLPVVSRASLILEDLKREFTVESIRAHEHMLQRMPREEALRFISEVTQFADGFLRPQGTASRYVVIELVNVMQQVYTLKLRPLQNGNEVALMLAACKALLNKYYGVECLDVIAAQICIENVLTLEQLSILTVDQPQLNQHIIGATSSVLLFACKRSGDSQFTVRLYKQLLQLAASPASFSATALHSFVLIAQDTKFAHVTRDIIDTSDAVDRFLETAALVVAKQLCDSHLYFRLAVLYALMVISRVPLTQRTVGLVLEVSMFFLNSHLGEIDQIFLRIFNEYLKCGPAAIYELRRLPIGKICMYFDESAAGVAALLCPCQLLGSNLKTAKTVSFVMLTELSKLDALRDVRCELVKLVFDEMSKEQKMCDPTMAMALVQELPYLAQFDKDMAAWMLKYYGPMVGQEANFQQGAQILKRVTAEVAAAKQIATLGNFIDREALRNRIECDPSLVVDANAVLQMANSQHAK